MRPSRVRLQVRALRQAEEEQRKKASAEEGENATGATLDNTTVAAKESTTTTTIITKTTTTTILGDSRTAPTTTTDTTTNSRTDTQVASTSHAIMPSSSALEGARQGHQHHVLVGSNFERLPRDATEHYAAWANGLDEKQLSAQRFRECTLVHPTWCLRRSTLDEVGS